ncbi:unnamed protein product [Prunus armeniaca]
MDIGENEGSRYFVEEIFIYCLPSLSYIECSVFDHHTTGQRLGGQVTSDQGWEEPGQVCWPFNSPWDWDARLSGRVDIQIPDHWTNPWVRSSSTGKVVDGHTCFVYGRVSRQVIYYDHVAIHNRLCLW